jgi:hypothetical protein
VNNRATYASDGWGGGVYFQDVNGVFVHCDFVNNTAKNGGGLSAVGGAVTLSKTLVHGNKALGASGVNTAAVFDFVGRFGVGKGIDKSTGTDGGGGLFFAVAAANIIDCTLSNNVVEGVNGAGGAIVFYGGFVKHLVSDCLITDNRTSKYGGGIATLVYTTPRVENCTFVNNTANTLGGSIFSDWSSRFTAVNSIFVKGNNRSIASDDFDQGTRITCSLFYDNPQGDYGLRDSVTGTVSRVAGTDLDPTNQVADPLFVKGPLGSFYLSQTAAGQSQNSPAVDAGNAPARDLGLSARTTRADDQPDEGQVDLGYHYPDSTTLPRYTLAARVEGGHGDVEPKSGTYFEGTLVPVTAQPDKGYRVAEWTGTDDDSSHSVKGLVVLWSDRAVVVEFDQPRTITVGSNPIYGTIQKAIDAAVEGDTVLVPTGTFSPTWVAGAHPSILIDKGITLTSENPDDPDCVAATRFYYVILQVATAGDTPAVIDGFTIEASRLHIFSSSPIVRNCVFTECHWFGVDGLDGDDILPTPPPNDGMDGASVMGGALLIFNGSPSVENCSFLNCSATGGNGGLGSNGDGTHPAGFDGGWAGGAYGGAVYCGYASNPTFKDCRFEGNVAQGGNGGDGGDGINNAHGGRGGNWIYAPSEETGPLSLPNWDWWDGWEWALYDPATGLPSIDFVTPFTNVYREYWRYSGCGGAVYCEFESSPKFLNCTFESNHSDGGASGLGGGPNDNLRTPPIQQNIENFGGAFYAAYGCTPDVVDCTFSRCWSDKQFDPNTAPDPNNIPDPNVGSFLRPEDYYFSYGGGLAFEVNCLPKLVHCTITDCNAALGGAIYWFRSNLEMTDCNLADNKAYHGGALYSVEANGTLSESILARNQAGYERGRPIMAPDPNDPNTLIPTVPLDLGPIFGRGGAYYSMSSPVKVQDSNFIENKATGSGGGVYFAGSSVLPDLRPCLFDSLLTRNTAGRDGGAVSVNWYSQPQISNCTLTENKVTGSLGADAGFGGGLYVSYNSNADLINSILWANVGVQGAQIAVGTGSEVTPARSNLTIHHCDIGPQADPNLHDPIIAIAKEHIQPKPYVAPSTTGSGVLTDSAEIYRRFNQGQQRVKVIVTLNEPVGLRESIDWSRAESVAQYRTEISNRRASVLSALQPGEFTTGHVLQNVAAFTGEASRTGLEKLAANGMIRSIEPARTYRPMLRQALALGNALEVRHAYSGKGVAIAIVDTGIDYTHPMLGGGTFPNTKVIGGYDTGDNDPDPMAGDPHGTACAGIAAGSLGDVGDYVGGVAYDAKLYALKAAPDSLGAFSNADILAAWDWCITHRNDDPQNPLLVISNSLGGWPWTTDPNVGDAASPAYAAMVQAVTNVGITILAASGNESMAGTGIASPANISGMISVGAVYDTTDVVTPYSNTAENLDVLAPADPVYTTDIVGAGGYTTGDYFPFFNGTSSATPFVAGCVASIQNAAKEKIGRFLTPAEVKELLIRTGDPVTDTKVAITKPRVNLGAALMSPSGPPIYVGQGCSINGWVAPVTRTYAGWQPVLWGPDIGVIEQDPVFVHGYYLSQTAAGQPVQSPAVDAGSAPADSIGLDLRTTRTDGVFDRDLVDLGYHYAQGVPRYDLKVIVVPDPNDGEMHGTVEPAEGSFLAGTELILKAQADPGYALASWCDVNDTRLSVGSEFRVVIDANLVLRVRFRVPQKVAVSGGGNAIQQAVNLAGNGDTLVIAPGTYDGNINLAGKQIRLVSTNPDDPIIVSQTVIDCGGRSRALIFSNREGPDTVISGLTIMNGAANMEPGGAIYIGPGASPTFVNVRISDSTVALSSGGAIYIGAGSNPTFEHVTIDKCSAVGALQALDPNDPNTLTRVGSGNGGGVYIYVESRPTFIDCAITNCLASGLGGAVYCGPGGLALFERCLFAGNDANDLGGAVYHTPKAASAFRHCTFTDNATDKSGGAIYYSRQCAVDVNDCHFAENSAPTSGGAIHLEPSSAGSVRGSTLVHNDVNESGGAIYLSGCNAIEVADCNVAYNTAHRGGGLYCFQSFGSKIEGCSIQYNEVLGIQRQYFIPDPNDPNGARIPVWPTDPNFSPSDPNTTVEFVRGGTAAAQGGGIYSFAGPESIVDCQISHNRAATSGGGVYLAAGEYKLRVLQNCLVTNNSSGRDGAGVSCNWQVKAQLRNCTLANNNVTSLLGSAFGGGLYVGYSSDVTVTDSIVWDNICNQKGAQLAVTDGPPYESTLHVSCSDVGPLDPNAAQKVGLDLVFVVDSSSSMVPAMTAVRAAATQIAGAVAGQTQDLRMAVVDFRDFNDTAVAGGIPTDYPFRVVAPFTEDAERIVRALNSITAQPVGGDVPESVFYALARTIDGNDLGGWRTGNVARVLVLIGDAPPHDPEQVVGYTLSDIVAMASKGPNKRIYTFQIGEYPATEAYFNALAGYTDGAAVQALDPNEPNDMTAATTAVVNAVRPLTRRGTSIYVQPGSQLPGWDPIPGIWDPDSHNLAADPLFVAGYYLSQTEAGQQRQSPAVDAGSGPADAPEIGLGARTTRTDGVSDQGAVDLGYHYLEGVTLYKLNAQVLPDPGDGLTHGTVTPNSALVQKGSPDNVIRLEVNCQPGWKIKNWTGTDNDNSTALVNFVTLTQDRYVMVTLEYRSSRVVTVPGDYRTIQDAVTAAEEGDTILVDPGVYTSGHPVEDANGVRFALVLDKAITVTSRNPDDPCSVAATIIRGPGTVGGNQLNNQGVLFRGETTRQTVFNGFTLENFGASVINGGAAGNRANDHPNGYDGAPVNGSAMILLRGASPTIKNCVIRNSSATGGNGGDGVGADATHNAGRGGWAGWARGGAIYCATETNPRFINCIIENNFAQGGNAGNGGAGVARGGLANYGGNYCPPVRVNIDPDKLGAEAAESDLWNLWEWDYALAYASGEALFTAADTASSGGHYVGDYRWYSGYGGGVFLDRGSKAEFVECIIRGNSTSGGLSGQGGTNAIGASAEPQTAFEIPSYGGGVYCAADTTVQFKNCLFQNNSASVTATQNNRLDPYLGYGGGVVAERSAAIVFVDCNFAGNAADTGGGVYLADSNVSVLESQVRSNTGLRGAGVAVVGGVVTITGCDVKYNQAILDATDTSDDNVLPIGAGLLLSSCTSYIQDCNIAANTSFGSGGGLYLRGDNTTWIGNCLIRDNLGLRDGGGISANWYAKPTIRNCTFVGNASPGLPADPNYTGFGGGLFSGYHSNCTIGDSIFWQNFARLGTELAVGTGFELDPQCGKISIAYSDIWAGPNDVQVDVGCKLIYGDGIQHADPLYVSGTLGDFFLSNRGAGQGRTSPCVDAGSGPAGMLGLGHYTTRTDRVPDGGLVDLGFHHKFLDPCRFCDLVHDGVIQFNDFAVFAMKWLHQGCSEANGWCGGADLTFDSRVNALDLAALADCWLARDTMPPVPNPPEWEVEPEMSGSNVAKMTVKEAVDDWGWDVEYYFQCVVGPGHDSGWQKTRTYADLFLARDTVYGYRVKARDAMGNETKWSTIRYAGVVDTTPPAPAPYIVTIVATSSQDVTMTARIAYDDLNAVEYFFDTNTPGAHDSGWISTPTYSDANLVPGTRYQYRVKARDTSARHNETAWSDWAVVFTQTPADTTAPTPNPMGWDPNGLPHELYGGGGTWDYYADMTALTATDLNGPVEYYFEAVDYPGVYPNGFSSGWINTPTWRVLVGRQNAAVRFRVKARDAFGNETAWSDVVAAILRPTMGTTIPAAAGGAAGGGAAGGGTAGGTGGGLVVP